MTFSGIYQMVAIRYTLTDNDEELTPSSVNMQRTLKAVNKIRLVSLMLRRIQIFHQLETLHLKIISTQL